LAKPLSPQRIASLEELVKLTKTPFRDLNLLNQAFCHRSFANESGFEEQDNERLEFLGDSVLGLLVVEYLYKTHPKGKEGKLANRKSKIVSAPILAKLAQDYQFEGYLLLGKGERFAGKTNRNIQADCFEAFLGALYLDSGLEACRNFLSPHLRELSELHYELESVMDYKTKLQEYCQKHWKSVPNYLLVNEDGSEHDKIFTVTVTHSSGFAFSGAGKNKKQAEQAAAKLAVQALGLK